MSNYQLITKETPFSPSREFLGYSEKWISDLNPKGIRICFRNKDGSITSARWDEEESIYNEDMETAPTHFMFIPKFTHNG